MLYKKFTKKLILNIHHLHRILLSKDLQLFTVIRRQIFLIYSVCFAALLADSEEALNLMIVDLSQTTFKLKIKD